MEKSIESIWKKGFLTSSEFSVPKLNNLYTKKSEHVVEKFSRMFKVNVYAIIAGSFVIMAMAYLTKIPYMGVGFFIMMNLLAYVNYKLMKGLFKIDKNVNSYQYLNSFNTWLEQMISLNKQFARVLYPVIFLALVTGFWLGSFGGDIPGDVLIVELLNRFPNMPMLFGFPVYLLLALLFIMVVLAISGGKIYQWDLNIVYGRLLSKLKDILADMEELRA